MASSLSPKELVEALFEAIEKKDFSTVRDVCDPDIDWVLNEGFPGGGHLKGVEEVISKGLPGAGRDWESFYFQPKETIGAGDCVVVLGWYRGRHRATGNKVEAAAAQIFDISNRRIARFRQFADTHMIHKAMYPS